MVRTVALALIASLVLAGASFAQTCPPNYFGQNLKSPSGTPRVQGARADSSCTKTPCLFKQRWDNAAGTAFVSTSALACDPGFGGTLFEFGQYTSDDYVLTGPSGANPVGFQVLLHVTGTFLNGCYTTCDPFNHCTTTCTPGTAKVGLTDGTQTAGVGPLSTINTALALSMSKTVGEHFHIDRSIYTSGDCGGGATVNTYLEFVLPPGYGLTSCYGYVVSSPVPALQASWGKVKTLYR